MRRKVSIRQEENRVLVIVDGRAVLDMPWQTAQELANAIRTKAALAREVSNWDTVARDDAILRRAGFPFGVANHPDVRAEARHMAQNDRELRRYMPQVKSAERFGVPTVRNRNAKSRDND